jgi:ribosome-associated protein
VSKQTLRPELRLAIEAAQDKQAAEVTLLDLSGQRAFTDAFLLCTGLSTPQVQAICEAIEEKLAAQGRRPDHREGRAGAEWLLLDYGSFIVHVFTERVSRFYDLARLWRNARREDYTDPGSWPEVSAAGGGSA